MRCGGIGTLRWSLWRAAGRLAAGGNCGRPVSSVAIVVSGEGSWAVEVVSSGRAFMSIRGACSSSID